jgi:hypothetical protein
VAFAVDIESVPDAEVPQLTASVLHSIPASGVPENHLPPVGAWRPYGGTITVGPPPTGRGKIVQVTPAGRQQCDDYLSLAAAVEADWDDRFGAAQIDALRAAAEAIAAALDPDLPPYVVVPWIGGTFTVHGA